ncbi:DHH family phosphoesterase [Aliarcobacter cibarius]|jgi:uncharacterized protein|uniref:Oligoribonuclease NrnB n=1 Tax=Aliarcobacter cibarius TaxID=255507 RepID=A0A5J6RLI2_9BACT|nr:phosphoesterase [Aliarcobacter cibarius]QEZ89748.1 oligoribonuclease NrnB [Aliarcobacter cibarius]QKJ27758.1 oligoribonuclease NrnB [Aliarcobacter cibarius]TLT01090.1 phosphoesterase [Aliarcobacter cibarius]TLT01187.1 phosphoesterase [Aliarcobacter cibarius]TLT04982.1 phosphoesterase [Aliarcobacter cibarius]
MRLFHISHTDLDGYSCQFLTSKVFEKTEYFNANYGMEVKLTILKVLENITNYKDEDILVIISDLNLTLQESIDLDSEIKRLNDEGYNITLQLLDHHITGKKSAEKFSWYFLDDKRCATKIVYDYLLEKFNASIKDYEFLVNCVNAVDIWLEKEKDNFEFGKVLMSMLVKAREINSILFPNLDREYKFYLLEKAKEFLGQDSANIKLDNDIHFLKKEFLKLDDFDDTLDNLGAKYLVKTLENVKDELTVTYKGQKGLLTYCLGSISIPANTFLKANKDYDFFIDINKKGNASFRADGKLDVSMLAQKIANGGGHVNASGGKFEDFKECIDYLSVKMYIQGKLDN